MVGRVPQAGLSLEPVASKPNSVAFQKAWRLCSPVLADPFLFASRQIVLLELVFSFPGSRKQINNCVKDGRVPNFKDKKISSQNMHYTKTNIHHMLHKSLNDLTDFKGMNIERINLYTRVYNHYWVKDCYKTIQKRSCNKNKCHKKRATRIYLNLVIYRPNMSFRQV